ncbi:ATP-dependent DNA helicase [Trichonephila clavipes]|nr:ATP-dependent DNA helicase [Trichonephila clavipes]
MGHPELLGEEAKKKGKIPLERVETGLHLSKRNENQKRDADKKRQAIYRALGKSGDCVKKYRSDPVKYERQMALQRERRAGKRQNIQIGSDSKRVCFDAESGVLWNKTRSKYFQAISDGPIHQCICCDRLWFKHSISHQSKNAANDRQLGNKGTIVNVPITLNQTVSTLPKNINDTATVHVKLKRRLKFKSDYMYRNPKRVFEAASFLMKTPLYLSQEVSLDSIGMRNLRRSPLALVTIVLLR